MVAESDGIESTASSAPFVSVSIHVLSTQPYARFLSSPVSLTVNFAFECATIPPRKADAREAKGSGRPPSPPRD